MAVLKLGIVTDAHLGLLGRPSYHNRLLGDRSTELLRSAVAAMNRRNVDVAIVLGDITNAGTDEELVLAKSILSGLRSPWWVIPGNHDALALRDGRFQAVFGNCAPESAVPWGDYALLFPRDTSPDASPTSQSFQLGAAQIDALVRAAARQACTRALVFTHAPLMSARAVATAHDGPYPGDFRDGENLVARLVGLRRSRVLLLAGHVHFHHIAHHAGWVQCLTGALVEYPMEGRIVVVDADAGTLRIETVPFARPDILAQSLQAAPWVAGEKDDRETAIPWP
jgi:3',5'-cyclic AMP phosphodiesterase CpdA